MVLGMDIANGEDFSANIAVTGDSGSLLKEPEDMGNPEWKTSVHALLF